MTSTTDDDDEDDGANTSASTQEMMGHVVSGLTYNMTTDATGDCEMKNIGGDEKRVSIRDRIRGLEKKIERGGKQTEFTVTDDTYKSPSKLYAVSHFPISQASKETLFSCK